MRCPFLKEVEVASCRSSAFRKPIVAPPRGTADGLCTSPEYAGCRVYLEHRVEDADGAHSCPYLERSLVQYCAAASPQKFIPYSESLLSRCGTGNHRYCDSFLLLRDAGKQAAEPEAEGIPVPRDLEFSSNHMWMASGEDGSCHAGIDAFAARVLGGIERITFVTMNGFQRPAAVLTVRGVDLSMVFPRRMSIQNVNTRLRGCPETIQSSPYDHGWLFEGTQAPAAPEPDSLLRGQAALEWMRGEADRLSRFAHAEAGAHSSGEPADGGVFAHDFVEHLDRESLLRLFNEFFSPYASPAVCL